ncbi:DUF1631 family protein [Inhella sp.]|uniref:DUF1631 family protein n=1 Tax=Inhella sp. TaxID=1921806 RepID=UPI0035AF987F
MAALDPLLQHCQQQLSLAFDAAIAKTIEASGQLAMSALKAARRDELLLTQGLLRQQQANSVQHFAAALQREWARQHDKSPQPRTTDWGELSLMEDSAVDAIVVSDRIGKALGHGSEWELRDMEAYTGALLNDESAGPDRNPLRPEVVARALLAAVDALTDQANLRQTLSEELTRALAPFMPAFYADTSEFLRHRGLQAAPLRPVSAEAASRPNASGAAPSPNTAGAGTPSMGGGASAAAGSGGLGGTTGSASGSYGGSGMRGGAGFFGQVDAGMMNLLRQLSVTSAPAPGSSLIQELAAEAAGASLALPGNVISLHREQLREATQTPLDHMVIDVVAGLFDAILADPKVPPQMARLLARLQLPVLRAALGDTSFFAKRKHPVRRFVNRLASLACAFDDFSHDPGLAFLRRVAELVEEIASGDFEKVKLYDEKLDALERVVQEQQQAQLAAASQAGQDGAQAVAMLERKELLARQQHVYGQQLEKSLADLPLPEFLRRFLWRDWAAVVVQSQQQQGDLLALQMKRIGRDLALSVLPKGGSPARREFLSQLPVLVRSVNQGLDKVGSPEPIRKQLFADLLPVHAESLKTPALSPLDHNLLVKRIEAAFGLAVPDEATAQRATAALDIDLEQVFAPAEAQGVGLMAEAAVAWSGEVDIALDAEEAPLAAVDIAIEGLPAPEAPAPTSGGALFDHLEIGCAYRLNTENVWRKVRLSHISAQRSFFIFTEGDTHPKTVTMTARMLRRLCESERLRAFESAHLLERATARARSQLAALLPEKS